MAWSQNDCLNLIDLYSKNEMLWNPKNPYHYNKNKKDEAWTKISETMGREEKKVRQKMTNLVISFRAQCRKVRKSLGKGAAEVCGTEWFAFERMKFLLGKDEPNRILDSQSAILDFADSQCQQSEVVQVKEENLANDMLHLDTEIPEYSNMPVETPKTSSTKRKRHQKDPRVEEAFKILKANKNKEDSAKEEMLDKDEPNRILDSQSAILDFADSQCQQSEVVQEKEDNLANDALHLDTEIPEYSNMPVKTPRTSSTKRKRHQKDPQVEEAFKILKANKNIEDSAKEEMLDFYGKYVISKIKNYSQQTQLAVEHEINKILFQADTGCYDDPVEIISSEE